MASAKFCSKTRATLALQATAAMVLILLSSPQAYCRQCHWCGPLADQVHRKERAPSCDSPGEHTMHCEADFKHCAVVATAPPYVESRYCVKLYQDECYPLYCNTTRTWRMTCPCRGDFCNGANSKRETEAFAVLSKLAGKNTLAKVKRSIKTSNKLINGVDSIQTLEHDDNVSSDNNDNDIHPDLVMNNDFFDKNISSNIVKPTKDFNFEKPQDFETSITTEKHLSYPVMNSQELHSTETDNVHEGMDKTVTHEFTSTESENDIQDISQNKEANISSNLNNNDQMSNKAPKSFDKNEVINDEMQSDQAINQKDEPHEVTQSSQASNFNSTFYKYTLNSSDEPIYNGQDDNFHATTIRSHWTEAAKSEKDTKPLDHMETSARQFTATQSNLMNEGYNVVTHNAPTAEALQQDGSPLNETKQAERIPTVTSGLSVTTPTTLIVSTTHTTKHQKNGSEPLLSYKYTLIAFNLLSMYSLNFYCY